MAYCRLLINTLQLLIDYLPHFREYQEKTVPQEQMENVVPKEQLELKATQELLDNKETLANQGVQEPRETEELPERP